MKRLALIRGFGFPLITLMMTISAGAQSAPAAQDPFGYWNATLSSAAEAVLTRATDSPGIPVPETTEPDHPEPSPDLLRDFARFYWNRREEDLQQALARVRELRPIIEPILRQQQVPPELIAAVLIESAGRSSALSRRGARGVWQLMPETARRYGLIVTGSTDERLDVVRSTRAAARYLSDLHAQFGSWRLALAAYNAGEGAVQQARERSGAVDFPRLLLFLPEETRNYVPAVWSAMDIVHGGAGPELE